MDPIIKAIIVDGTILLIFLGIKKRIRRPRDPTRSACPLTFEIFCKLASALITCGFAPRPNKIVS